MDVYYSREAPIPADAAQACRLVRAQSKDERKAVDTVLREFFTLTDDGWRHARCDAEIAVHREKSAKAAKSAKQRWSVLETAKRFQSDGNANADANGHANAYTDAMPTQSEGNATKTKTKTTTHPTDAPSKDSDANASVASALSAESVADSETSENGCPNCPISDIVDAYHAILPQLPRVLVRTAVRDGLIRQRWRDVFASGKASGREDGVKLFCEFFEHVAESKFLCGRSESRNGSPPFVADLEWLMRPTNFAKVVEGRYHRG
jgi:uncharacterized protein YdaU (DUF1376 family)